MAAVSARAIVAYFRVAPSNHEDLEAVQRRSCENVKNIWKLFRLKRSALEAAHAHLHDVRTYINSARTNDD